MGDVILTASTVDLDLVAQLTVFVLAAFVGFEVISKVPATLHTPLMSQTNAIHGIVVLGGLIVIGSSATLLTDVIGWIAIFFGTVNVVGGFLVTDRMLGMFIRKPKKQPDAKSDPLGASRDHRRASSCRATSSRSPTSSPSSSSSSACARARARPPPVAAT